MVALRARIYRRTAYAPWPVFWLAGRIGAALRAVDRFARERYVRRVTALADREFAGLPPEARAQALTIASRTARIAWDRKHASP